MANRAAVSVASVCELDGPRPIRITRRLRRCWLNRGDLERRLIGMRNHAHSLSPHTNLGLGVYLLLDLNLIDLEA